MGKISKGFFVKASCSIDTGRTVWTLGPKWLVSHFTYSLVMPLKNMVHCIMQEAHQKSKRRDEPPGRNLFASSLNSLYWNMAEILNQRPKKKLKIILLFGWTNFLKVVGTPPPRPHINSLFIQFLHFSLSSTSHTHTHSRLLPSFGISGLTLWF